MNNAFQIYRYIAGRMKACAVPSDAISCDADERILSIATRALKTHWITQKRTEEMYFIKIGDRWVSELRMI